MNESNKKLKSKKKRVKKNNVIKLHKRNQYLITLLAPFTGLVIAFILESKLQISSDNVTYLYLGMVILVTLIAGKILNKCPGCRGVLSNMPMICPSCKSPLIDIAIIKKNVKVNILAILKRATLIYIISTLPLASIFSFNTLSGEATKAYERLESMFNSIEKSKIERSFDSTKLMGKYDSGAFVRVSIYKIKELNSNVDFYLIHNSDVSSNINIPKNTNLLCAKVKKEEVCMLPEYLENPKVFRESNSAIGATKYIFHLLVFKFFVYLFFPLLIMVYLFSLFQSKVSKKRIMQYEEECQLVGDE